MLPVFAAQGRRHGVEVGPTGRPIFDLAEPGAASKLVPEPVRECQHQQTRQFGGVSYGAQTGRGQGSASASTRVKVQDRSRNIRMRWRSEGKCRLLLDRSTTVMFVGLDNSYYYYYRSTTYLQAHHQPEFRTEHQREK